jgi:DNA repair protein RecN (Recombination protein N)
VGVIAQARFALDPGLTVITGETGAGKTMLLEALNLLMGGKHDPQLVRAGAVRSVVEGAFELPEGHPAVEQARDAGALVEDGELLVVRTVPAKGRSRAVAGGAGVPAGMLAQLMGPLVAVHGQADQQRLRSAAQQRAMLDEYAGPAHGELLTQLSAAHAQLRETAATLERLRSADRTAAREAEMLKAAIAEIEQVDPQPGEEAEVQTKLERAENAEYLRGLVASALAGVAGSTDDIDDRSALAGLGQARRALEQAQSRDSSLEDLAQRAAELTYLAQDLGQDISTYIEELDVDPASLTYLQERRAALKSLLRKYGASIEEVLDWSAHASEQLAQMDASAPRIEALETAARELREQASALAAKVTSGRERAARRLEKAMAQELKELGMGGAQFEVHAQALDAPGPSGAENIEFYFSSHRGVATRPLARGASGGELSRLMLALEVVLAGHGASHKALTLVFDEVDAGIGGEAAGQVGKRLALLARSAQVIVVTHLAQVAAYANGHVVVTKDGAKSAPVTTVREIDGTQRVRELARMLAGMADSDTAQEHARELLAQAIAAE